MTENLTDIERLRWRHEKYQASGALPKYWDAVFYHFPTAGTICVRVFSPTHVAVGLAMLALLPPQIKPDVYSKNLGRIISYGRSLRVRNYAGIHEDALASAAIRELRAMASELDGQLYVEVLMRAHSFRLQRAMVSVLVTPKEEPHATGH